MNGGNSNISSFSRFMAGSLPSSVFNASDPVPGADRGRDDNPYSFLISRRPDPKSTLIGPIKTGKGLDFMTPGGFKENTHKEKYWLETVTALSTLL